jgi:hypothetical protein
MELRHIGQPLLIRDLRMEIPLDRILWRWADFAKLKAGPTPSVHSNDQAFLFHQVQHHFFWER